MKLHGQIAIVNGGARGIGKAIALRFANEGAQIALVDLEIMRASLDQAALEITQKGAPAIGFACSARGESEPLSESGSAAPITNVRARAP